MPTRRSKRIASSPFLASNDHGEDAGRFLFLLLVPVLFPSFGSPWSRIDDQIGQSCVVEDMGCGVANVQKDLIKRPVRQIPINQDAQLLGIPERSQRAVNQPDDLAQSDIGWVAAQMVATFRAPNTLDNAGVLEFQQDQFEELFREILLVSDVADLDRPLMVVAREHHHGLQGVESLFADLHIVGHDAINSISIIDFIDYRDNANAWPCSQSGRKEL